MANLKHSVLKIVNKFDWEIYFGHYEVCCFQHLLCLFVITNQFSLELGFIIVSLVLECASRKNAMKLQRKTLLCVIKSNRTLLST